MGRIEQSAGGKTHHSCSVYLHVVVELGWVVLLGGVMFQMAVIRPFAPQYWFLADKYILLGPVARSEIRHR